MTGSYHPRQRHRGRTQTVARLVWVVRPLGYEAVPRGYEDADDDI